MKNLLKWTLGVLAATAALAVLASAAVAATPTLSPVPTECSGCTTGGLIASGKGGSFGTWHSAIGGWTWEGLSVDEGAYYEAWNEGTTIRNLRLTFEHFPCKNEGNNFTTEPLKGRLAVVEGLSAVLLEPEAGSTIGKCTFSGSKVVVTGSYIAQAYTSGGNLYFSFSGAGLRQLTPLEPEHVILTAIEGTKEKEPSTLGGATYVPAYELEVHTAGRTATFATPKYAGGFELGGGTMQFLSKSGLKISCYYTSGSGQFTSATGGYVYLRFTSCKGALGCTATGWENLARLKVQLAYTYPATETPEGRQVGLVLSPESGGNMLESECGKVKFATKGSLIAVISPLAKASSTFALSMKQSGGQEEHTTYEGSGGEAIEAKLYTSIEGAKWEQSGLEDTTTSIYLNAGGAETIK